MKEFYSLPQNKRKMIIEGIKKALQKREEIVFAYAYGSFLEDPCFRDIDIGVYLKPKAFAKERNSYNYNFELAAEIEKEIGYHFLLDVRILNEAPFNFLNNVFSRGKLLLCRNEDFLTDLIEKTSQQYIIYRPYAEQYLRERLGLA